MGLFNRSSKSSGDATQTPPDYADEKHVGRTEYQDGEYPNSSHNGVIGPNEGLHRGLKSRHITMIAIGGAVGTGLIIGTGKALYQAGPGSILISYTAVGLLVYMVMCGLGEMAAWLPHGSGFSGYATRFVDPAFGFALGWTYWFKYIITTPNQLTAASLVIQYWVKPSTVNPGVFIAIFLVIIICINYFGVKFFGEFEFWLSSLKVVVIVALILMCFIFMLGGGPNHDRTGFRYYKHPGAFKEYIGTGSKGKFLGFWSSLVTAVFAYLGTELVGVTVGEAQNPRKTIPRAIKLTFYRILFFYVFSVLLLGMLVPYNSNDLKKATLASTNSAASPFVVAIQLNIMNLSPHDSHRSLPHILNGAILIFTFSASNSDLYIASRTIYGLAVDGNAPKIFAYTDKRGVPIAALAVSSLFCCLAFMNVSDDSKVVFGYFVNLVTIFGLLTWISILVTHIFFVRARRAQGITNAMMPYVAPGGLIGSYIALFFCILIALTKNFNVFTYSDKYGKFDYKNFITGYLGIPLYLIMIFGYKLLKKSHRVKPMEADFYTGKDIIDRQEEEFLANKAANAGKQTQGSWFYRHFVAWIL